MSGLLAETMDDESLRKWKEQLLGSVDVSHIEESRSFTLNINLIDSEAIWLVLMIKKHRHLDLQFMMILIPHVMQLKMKKILRYIWDPRLVSKSILRRT
nr:hypothetical protein [Tanacetum cinerariifolium]